MRIGIISPSEIAFRRFLPALTKHGKFTYAGVAVPSAQDWNGEGTKQIPPLIRYIPANMKKQ